MRAPIACELFFRGVQPRAEVPKRMATGWLPGCRPAPRALRGTARPTLTGATSVPNRGVRDQVLGVRCWVFGSTATNWPLTLPAEHPTPNTQHLLQPPERGRPLGSGEPFLVQEISLK